ncbi:hypothetical protein L798_07929 [Zootermopsis nevadensis]|uniref:Uncharacterized protein n=1 Tax=Zootermopsis nevadensis TaxID=136037 RepID=A0A067RT51_ZOONE|nr:hypothetical protein L798_07929 [Zootermopsis nevadensis]
MSEHFLKYAVLASYLEPKMPDVELIDAVKFHFPIYVQNSFAAAQLTCIQDTLDLQKHLEGIEMCEGQQQLNSAGTSQNQGHDRSHGNANDRSSNNRPRPQSQQVSFTPAFTFTAGVKQGDGVSTVLFNLALHQAVNKINQKRDNLL